MDSREIKQCIDRVEDSVDQAKNAAQTGAVPQDLRLAIDTLHQQARQAKQGMDASSGEAALRDTVMQLEKSADQAMAACRNAGAQVDPRVQQAVQKAHEELSNLKKQVQAGSPA